MAEIEGQSISRYRLDSVIGEGGMGIVYKAYDQYRERAAALKVIHPQFVESRELRSKMSIEAQTMSQLDHKSIVKIYEFGEADNRAFIAMEYIGGGNLRSHLSGLQRSGRYLPIDQSLQIAAQIAGALDYAHKHGVVHRDVKPGNILLKKLASPDREGDHPFRAVLTDFGLVKLLEGQELSQTGTTMGTPTYMSPEQCQGLPLDGRSDLYALGVVLYELLTNQLPFEFKTLPEAMAVHFQGVLPPPPTHHRPDLPVVIDGLLKRSLAKDKSDRFESGAEMSSAMRSLMASIAQESVQPSARKSLAAPLTSAQGQAGSYKLIIKTLGQDARIVRLTSKTITVGRNPDNDIVLPGESVSGHHAVIFQGHDQEWMVSDLGGIGGTFLDSIKLPVDQEVILPDGSLLEIGPYSLIFTKSVAEKSKESSAEMIPISEMPTDSALAAATAIAAQTDESDLQLSMRLFEEEIKAVAGQPKIVNVEIINHGKASDWVKLRIHDLPPGWLKAPGTFSEVIAGRRAVIPLQIVLPKSPSTRPGSHLFHVSLISQQYPDINIDLEARLVISPFEDFRIDLQPKRVKLPEKLQITILNAGNVEAEFSLSGRDRRRILKYQGETERFRLNPGQRAIVDMQIESAKRKLFGAKEEAEFQIIVSSRDAGDRHASATAVIAPVIPRAALYLAIFSIVFICALVVFGIVSGSFRTSSMLPPLSDGLIGGIDSLLTATDTAAEMSTKSSAVTGDPTPSMEAATENIDDLDGDGLSNSQESIIGSDPTLVDSDSDSLNDGEEVLTWSTSPTNSDTDGDLLRDGDEVYLYGTSPSNSDTDGDGQDDGSELSQGTDPLDAQDPEPQSTLALNLTIIPPTSTGEADEPAGITPVQSTNTAPLPTEPNIVTPVHSPTINGVPSTTGTPDATPEIGLITPDATAPSGYLVPCTTETPTIDGSVLAGEWPEYPFAVLSSKSNRSNNAQVYIEKDNVYLYLGAIIHDSTFNPSQDELILGFDPNLNGGDPDLADRMIRIVRGGAVQELAGIGGNDDGVSWNRDYLSENLTLVFGEDDGNRWIFELSINYANEMPDLLSDNPFGLFIYSDFSGDAAGMPDSGSEGNASSWLQAANPSCS